MFEYISLFITFIFLFTQSNLNAQNTTKPLISETVLDIRDLNFVDGSVNLNGKWNFTPGILISDKSGLDSSSLLIDVPGLINDVSVGGKKINSEGCGSYQLTIKSKKNNLLAFKLPDAATSYALFLNQKQLAKNGIVSCDPNIFKPQYRPLVIPIELIEGDNDLVIQVANFSHHKFGLWEPIRLGYASQLYSEREWFLGVDLFLAGSFLIMALYHFGLFFLRRNDYSSLWFGLMCMLLTVRMITTGERLLIQIFPDFHFEFSQKLEYLSIYLVNIVFMFFFQSLFAVEFTKTYLKILSVPMVILTLVTIFSPLYFYSQFLIIYFIISILMLSSGVYYLAKSVKNKRIGSLASLVGLIFFTGTALNDILYNLNVFESIYLLPFGLFGFIFSQSFILSLRFSKAFTKIENLSISLKETTDDLIYTNQAYSRFVPREFLSLLSKNSIQEIKLGDQAQLKMTVLFSDIADFTMLSEGMTPKENFDFLNSYLRRMDPAITTNAGFTDKYIGDSIMCLFPRYSDDALKAARDMQWELKNYNNHRLTKDFAPITIRIGIHTGVLMIGTIGSENRMEGTVISDTVNAASRIEGLNKVFSSTILFSEDTYSFLRKPEDFQCRRLGKVVLKGKSKSMNIYELLDEKNPTSYESILNTKDIFEESLIAYENGDLQTARSGFTSVLEKNPSDNVSKHYLDLTK
ncbi:MAG: adenylate/guanylate cyclase domain-containing protein [Leptospira sp.]|nr:adenylate/guanylate cyclase domain-containing protein [Leptospira sp.]